VTEATGRHGGTGCVVAEQLVKRGFSVRTLVRSLDERAERLRWRTFCWNGRDRSLRLFQRFFRFAAIAAGSFAAALPHVVSAAFRCGTNEQLILEDATKPAQRIAHGRLTESKAVSGASNVALAQYGVERDEEVQIDRSEVYRR
jgi:hypothetical protein